MPTTPATHCKASQTWLIAGTFTLLSACSSIQVSQPPDIVATTTTKIVVTGNSSYTGLRVSLDGNDVSNQMVYQGAGSNRDEGTFGNLAAGMHTVVASANVPCWYCTGQTTRSTDTKAFCVSAAATKITFAQADNLSWASAGASLSQAADSGKCATRWRFIPSAPGIGTTVGRIESAESPGRCFTSPDDNVGSVISLTACNPADLRQRWHGRREQLTTGKGFYAFENQSPTSTFRCLTQMSGGGAVIQSACNTTSTAQLWAVRNNTTGLFETEVHPWGQ